MKKKKIDNCRINTGFINLNLLEKYKEKGEVVEGSSAKSWFNVEGSRFLFKEYSNVLPAFGEVLYSKVAKDVGVNCAEYDFAQYNSKIGTISYDFLNNEKVYYNCLELTTKFADTKFSYDEICNNRDLLIMHNNKYNNMIAIKELLTELFNIDEEEQKKLEIELVKMFVLDTVFWHKDRNLWNYGVVVDEESDKMSFAPLHDNSYVLCLQKGKEYIESMIVSLINGEKLESVDSSLSFASSFDGDDSMGQLIKLYSQSDEDIKAVIEGLLRDINIENQVNDLIDLCEIGEIEALWIKAVLNYRKITILKGIESVKINEDKAIKPNVTFSKRK